MIDFAQELSTALVQMLLTRTFMKKGSWKPAGYDKSQTADIAPHSAHHVHITITLAVLLMTVVVQNDKNISEL